MADDMVGNLRAVDVPNIRMLREIPEAMRNVLCHF